MIIASGKRLCVVTPYFKEPQELLARCVASVHNQTIPVDHFVIADGFPSAWMEQQRVRHISLDRAHGDFGNFARGIGALMAISERYDGIAFLDADNWYQPDHFEVCLRAAGPAPLPPYVIARRDFVRLDESVIPIRNSEDVPMGDHVDTNCYLFLPPSYHLLHFWCTLPRELSSYGDRFFRQLLKAHFGTSPAVVTHKPTVKYQCLFESIYSHIGETPPPGAKPNIELQPCLDWLISLSDEDLNLAERMTGLRLSDLWQRA